MAITVVDFQTLKDEVMAIINVCTAVYGTYSVNPSFFEAFIEDAIFDADLEIQRAIVNNAEHSQRPNYLTTTTVLDGAKLPSAVGDLGPVEIETTAGATRVDRKVSLGDLELWKADTSHVLFGSLDDIEGHFAIAGDRIYFIGATCTITYPTVTRGSASGLFAPIEYINTAKGLVAGNVLLKDPEFASQTQMAMSIGMAGLQGIARSELVVPELRPQMMQQAA